ncbi:MAG: 3-hydroxybutyryl-CoA dehydrogenase [Bacteroidia bacterium]|nr:3-hydroxybutyryl-CoA dehydrogenase [Bacteroidia bacterium]
MTTTHSPIAVAGAGTMGSDIARLAAFSGFRVLLYDSNAEALERSYERLSKSADALIEKGKISRVKADESLKNITKVNSLEGFSNCGMVIEAIVEELSVKQDLFRKLEGMVSKDCILATNTSSISVTSIAAACSLTSRVVGIHFFNPAHLMPLVEIVPGMATAPSTVETAVKLIKSWGKTTVKAKDTPGFIVNRVARPFYGEAIRIYEEGIADFATIDWAMKEIGGFKMGPFELMDFIGNDINYKVTETVWTQFFFDPRYKPSLTQKRLYEAGYWGRKKGRGYYDYSPGAPIPEPKKEKKLGEEIFLRILSMLINEAYEAWYYNIATRDELETAMTKGVNYPKGLIQWAEEIGVSKVADKLEQLQHTYNEDRYRPSLLLKKQARP